MMRALSAVFFLILFLFPLTVQASYIKNVIYVTLDGVRWQDIMQEKKYFPRLWSRHAQKMEVYGLPGGANQIEVASIPVSLPSYQSQMSGAVQACQYNNCGRVRVMTVLENLKRKLNLQRHDIAVFSSWPIIAHAAESQPGTVYTNVGNIPVYDPLTNKPDAFMKRMNKLQQAKHHKGTNRMDTYTFMQAMHYFNIHKPKVLWISLVNADNEAHDGNLKNYRQTLSLYDKFIDDIFSNLNMLGMQDNTLVIITTDHGRGTGHKWTTHGPQIPESKRTWAFVYNGVLTPIARMNGNNLYSTLSIRPTIERVLGVM